MIIIINVQSYSINDDDDDDDDYNDHLRIQIEL